MRLSTLFAAMLALVVWSGTAPVMAAGAAGAEINVDQVSKLAIHGYDPVAYFRTGRPAKGKPEFTVTWKNAKWAFSSAENRDLFKADPQAYAPQYGGYCAYGAAHGHMADGDPEAWTIHAGKLYLNLNARVHEVWQTQIDENISAGDKKWPELVQQ
ncbi:MAG: YHS domain-containing (seleno)protein [Hyphomicrobiales bacterium]